MTKSIKPISMKSFKQIKNIAQALKKEVDYNKAHNRDQGDDYDFSCFNDPKVSGYNIAVQIDNNLDILAATNFNVVFPSDGEILVTYADLDPIYDDSLGTDEVLNVMNKLVKLGRMGIARRIKVTNKLNLKVQRLQSQMDLA